MHFTIVILFNILVIRCTNYCCTNDLHSAQCHTIKRFFLFKQLFSKRLYINLSCLWAIKFNQIIINEKSLISAWYQFSEKIFVYVCTHYFCEVWLACLQITSFLTLRKSIYKYLYFFCWMCNLIYILSSFLFNVKMQRIFYIKYCTC